MIYYILKISLTLILILPQIGFSQDNTCNEAGSSTDLHFPIQDQDGLGTCYANSTSLLIQSTLGLESPPSYQQLALIYSIDKGTNKNLINQEDGKDSYAAEGGFVCDTFNAAKYYGFCDAQHFNLDVYGNEDGIQKQKKLIMGYGRLIDDLGRNFLMMNEKKWDTVRNNLISQIYNKKKDCGDSKEDFFKRKVLEKLPRMVLQRIGGLNEQRDLFQANKNEPGTDTIFNETEQEYKLWEKIRDTQLLSSKTKDGGLSWSLNKEFSNLITPSLISEWIKGTENLKPKSYFGEMEILIPEVTSPTNLLFKNFSTPLDSFTSKESFESLKDLSGRGLIFEISQEWENCLVDIDDKMLSSIHLENLINVNQCSSVANYSLLDPVLVSASQVADDLVNKLKDKKLKNYDNRAQALMDVFSPQCRLEAQNNTKQISNKFCFSYSFKDFGKSDQVILPKMRRLISENLCKKNPISISVCTKFMSGTELNIDTQYCQNDKTANGDNQNHGYHALTIVGHQIDKDNSAKYLIQNSWGKTCGVLNPKEKGVECELDSNGKTTGRFWIGENLLLKNTYQLNMID
jgi:hypothetical protein